MNQRVSKTATGREAGKHQVEEQRASILDAAEMLFLQQGIEKTTMLDIATAAGITRVTLYRYFANRDEIAVTIHMRMLHRISDKVGWADRDSSLAEQRERARSMIRNFPALRDAFRYVGMFDQIYLDNPPESALAQWTKDQLDLRDRYREPGDRRSHRYRELPVILNDITWFLEKLALRGELTWSDQTVPLSDHLQFYEEMIMRAFDGLQEQAKDPREFTTEPKGSRRKEPRNVEEF